MMYVAPFRTRTALAVQTCFFIFILFFVCITEVESRTQGSRPRPRTQKIAEVESRTQGSRPRPRPRTQKKSEAKAKDSLFEDRHSRGQGQECSRPRPRTKDISASALQNKKKGLHKNFSGDQKKKRSSQKFFKRSPQKIVFQKIFQALHKILTIQKIVLSSSRGQANFRGLEASKPRPRT